MTLAVAADPAQARAALAATANRLTALLRTSTRPGAHAIGVWDVADTAVHLGNAWDILPALARREQPPLIEDVWDLGGLTTSLTSAATDHDLNAIADRIDAAASSFLALAAEPDGEARPWLVHGVEVPMTTFVCHLLNESLVHGFDIARAQGRPWRIDAADAALVLRGFLFPVLGALPPTAMVVPERVAGLSVRYRLHLRPGGSVDLVFEDGAVRFEPPSPRRVDCHIGANAASLFLVIWGRQGQWRSILTGGLISWGRRPWLGPRLRTLLRNP